MLQGKNWAGASASSLLTTTVTVSYNIPSDVFERIWYLCSTSNVRGEPAGGLAKIDLVADELMDQQSQEAASHPNALMKPQAANEVAPEGYAGKPPLRICKFVALSSQYRAIGDIAVDCKFGCLNI
jgi:hypothetical protein